jgi:hypothetical protein
MLFAVLIELAVMIFTARQWLGILAHRLSPENRQAAVTKIAPASHQADFAVLDLQRCFVP